MSAVLQALDRAEAQRTHTLTPALRRDLAAAELRGLRRARSCVHVGAGTQQIWNNIDALMADCEREYVAACQAATPTAGEG